MKVSKKARSVGATPAVKTATVAKTETPVEKKPKMRVNLFGAPSQRPNRQTTGKSELGNRKWIFRAVVSVGKNGVITRENTVEALEPKSEFVAYDTKEQAHAAADVARKANPDIINARTFARGGKIALWLAFVADNGKMANA